MERGLGPQDAQRRLGPLELTLARQGEGGGGGLLLVEHQLPSQTRKIHCREESRLLFLDVGQRLVGFLEFNGALLTRDGVLNMESAFGTSPSRIHCSKVSSMTGRWALGILFCLR